MRWLGKGHGWWDRYGWGRRQRCSTSHRAATATLPTHPTQRPLAPCVPRRTAFVFELDDPAAPDVPTTLRRSKEDCPRPPETAMGVLDVGVLQRIAKIMSYMTVAGE